MYEEKSDREQLRLKVGELSYGEIVFRKLTQCYQVLEEAARETGLNAAYKLNEAETSVRGLETLLLPYLSQSPEYMKKIKQIKFFLNAKREQNALSYPNERHSYSLLLLHWIQLMTLEFNRIGLLPGGKQQIEV
jgi:hypothetical protein